MAGVPIIYDCSLGGAIGVTCRLNSGTIASFSGYSSILGGGMPGGTHINNSEYSTIVMGQFNYIGGSQDCAQLYNSIINGECNAMDGCYSSIFSGCCNQVITDRFGTVLNGYYNRVTGAQSHGDLIDNGINNWIHVHPSDTSPFRCLNTVLNGFSNTVSLN